MPQWADRKVTQDSSVLADAQFAVEDTIKLRGGKVGHIGRKTDKGNVTVQEMLVTLEGASAKDRLQIPVRTTVPRICCRRP